MKTMKCFVTVLLCGGLVHFCAINAGDAGDTTGLKSSGDEGVPGVWQRDESAEKSGGLTTTNDARGNWYLKKQIVQKARRLYEELRQLILKVEPARATFSKKRNELDTLLNAFYQKCGFQSGEIEERLKVIDEEIKRMESAANTPIASPVKAPLKRPSEKEVVDENKQVVGPKPLGEVERKKLLQELQEKRTQVEKLREEFKFVHKLDAKSVEALSTLTDGLDKLREYEEQAYTSYEKILDTINDEIAETAYRAIETAYYNVQAFDRYIKGEFSQFFDALRDQITVQMDVCNKQIEALRSKGIELNKKILEEKAREEKARLEAQRQKALLEQQKKNETVWTRMGGFFARLWALIAQFFVGLWQTVVGWFGGARK